MLKRSILATAAISALIVGAACSREASVAETPAPPVAATHTKAAMKVADFKLADQYGKQHRLYDLAGKKAVVLIMQGNGCPIVQKLTPAINEISTQYGPKNIEFLMLNSNLADTPKAILDETNNFGLKVPVLKDEGQKLGISLGVERTAEAIVIDPKTWTVTYHGAIDDRLDYGREKPKPDHRYLATVLDAMLTGAPVPHYVAPASGCLINFEKKQG